MTRRPPALCHGQPPLTARTEPWMEDLLADPEACRALIDEYGSPVNVHDFAPLARHCRELVEAAAECGVPLRVFVARKANKTLGLVDAATSAGHGIDVASYHELRQCLERGVSPQDLIVTAAVKSQALLTLAVSTGVVVSVDNQDELEDLLRVASGSERGANPVEIALRLSPTDPDLPTSRFGLPAEQWLSLIDPVTQPANARGGPEVLVSGLHFHLNGYSAPERVRMLVHACKAADALRAIGHPVAFIDMGGGVPMSYLDDEEPWRAFWRALDADTEGVMTWKGDRLGLRDPDLDRPSESLYPFWQPLSRGPWLLSVLRAEVPDSSGNGSTSVAQMLIDRGLELRCEPGRAVLDGCGLTLASVAFRKHDRDGNGLVGLHMNRTQMRSTSADVLLDPRWVRLSGAPAGEPQTAFLVGAYCVEDEAILRRRLTFPTGVDRQDIAAFINTAGYLMHIVESASHQLPLARNVVRCGDTFHPDAMDAAPPEDAGQAAASRAVR
ncbi:type III PLP-dependent enzyme domain-containing protein [Galactobacter valiniphilus]|uniref:Y4yA family PLP-dependent enzyme n=1 Tax=Galactobacter valiniphilus TaxID=2676122 RepID=UPI0037365437